MTSALDARDALLDLIEALLRRALVVRRCGAAALEVCRAVGRVSPAAGFVVGDALAELVEVAIDGAADRLAQSVGRVEGAARSERSRQGHRKGKSREDASLKDEEVAFKLYAEDLEAYLLRQEDIHLARSLVESNDSDDESLQEDNELDEVAWKDREIALCAAGSGRTPVTAANATPSQTCHLLGDKASCSNSISREPTTTNSHRGEPSSSQLQECVICCVTVPRDAMYIASCPNRHTYHSRCLLALIHASMKDESLMPPVCCKVRIDENLFLPLLNEEDRDEFIRKREEFGTKDRLYCNNVSCSEFLGAVEREAKQLKKCDRCGNETCKACKGPWHGYKSICAGDSDEAAIDLLRDIGMQRCPCCLRMVELIDGCYHITCICGSEFCYLCAEDWGMCSCEQ
ncbi:hypothetical protein L7F22_032384 [Adiantum nelumboides]|nr:hypothetical protein [Adiantum nelumboides]